MRSAFELLYIVAGLWLIWQWIRISFLRGQFNLKLLLAEDLTIETCRDPEGMHRYLAPRLLLCGILLTIYGVASLINSYQPFMLGWPFIILFLCTFIAAVVIYGITAAQARKRFW